MKKVISFLFDGILAGVFLSIGCAASMSADNKALGAFLFSLGLFAIITFKLGLFTGKAGYMAVKPPSYIGEVAVTIVGNACGAAIGGTLLRLTRFAPVFTEKASYVIDAKFADNPVSIFILAVFCGIMMFTAVDGNKREKESGNHTGAVFVTVLPIMIFIMCGFNHCIADMAYFFISGCSHADGAAMYFLMAVLGNAVGCMLIPMIKKLSINK